MIQITPEGVIWFLISLIFSSFIWWLLDRKVPITKDYEGSRAPNDSLCLLSDDATHHWVWDEANEQYCCVICNVRDKEVDVE